MRTGAASTRAAGILPAAFAFMRKFIELGLALLGLFFIARYFGGVGIGAPWLPVRKRDIEAAFELVPVGSDDVVYDLGSGDGRLLVEAARRGATVVGYELNPILVWISRFRLKSYGLRSTVYRRNLLESDLSRATVVMIFGMEWIMPLVSEKIKKECRPGTRIVSFAFGLPGLAQTKALGIAKYYEA